MALVCLHEGLFAEAVVDLVRDAAPDWLCAQRDPDAVDGAPLPADAEVVLAVVDRHALGADFARGVAQWRRRFDKAAVLAIDRDAAARVPIARLPGAGATAVCVPARWSRPEMRGVIHAIVEAARGTRRRAAATTRGSRRPEPTSADFGLTRTEQQVLALLARGLTNDEIARRRDVAQGTVRIQVSAVLAKLGARNRFEATWIALRLPGVLQALVSEALAGDTGLGALMPHLEAIELPAGTRLFARGDRATAMYRVQGGVVDLPEIGVEMRAGDWFGEIGLLSADGQRTCSAVCRDTVQLFRLTADKVRQMFFVNPEFALNVLEMVTRRLMADRAREVTRRS
jgi:DNA-binding NarL/FixJ family response regulator